MALKLPMRPMVNPTSTASNFDDGGKTGVFIKTVLTIASLGAKSSGVRVRIYLMVI